MKHLTLFALTIMFFGSPGIAIPSEPNLEGSHRGIRKENGEEHYVDLVFKSVPGRSGSYLAILAEYEMAKKIKGSEAGLQRLSIYRVAPLRAMMFDMTPMTVTLDGGIIGINNSDPSLSLNITGTLFGKPTMSITSANSSNQDQNRGTFLFDQKSNAHITWGKLASGQYKLKGGDARDIKMTVSEEDAEFQANATLMLDDLNGQFLVEQAQPGMHVLKVVSVKSTGLKPEEYPKRIGIPLVIDDKNYFVLLDCGSKKLQILLQVE